jgi:hypothetical protein
MIFLQHIFHTSYFSFGRVFEDAEREKSLSNN